ncbi:cytochrome c maturation protein CcmE [Alphaproteobacteria bacterium LSUCC0684]
MADLSPKMRRGIGLAAAGAVLALAASLVLVALEDTVVYFYGPTDLMGKPLDDRRIRVGGLVVEGSVAIDGIDARFDVSDGTTDVTIAYRGVLPDLFREGQGIIAEGTFNGKNFTADTVLAKHDETYMPKEVAETLKEQGVWQGGETGN